MIKLHLSKEDFKSSNGEIDSRKPTPACGVEDARGILRCGNGVGLVSMVAYSYEVHCPECIKQKKYKHFAY